jgi:hypothetical protein
MLASLSRGAARLLDAYVRLEIPEGLSPSDEDEEALVSITVVCHIGDLLISNVKTPDY